MNLAAFEGTVCGARSFDPFVGVEFGKTIGIKVVRKKVKTWNKEKVA